MAAPSEEQIGIAIDSLGPIEFQMLAERFVRLRDPNRFDRLAPVGRNEKGKGANIWGDGRVAFADGHIDVVEATTREAPEKHLHDDLAKIAGHFAGRVDGFLFVASGREPSEDLVSAFFEKFVKLGVPADRIDLIFRKRLVSELTNPRYSTLWAELELPVTPAPFSLIEDAQIFGDGTDRHRFVPTRADFEEGLVPWLPIHSEILARVEEYRCALIRGGRSVGKTVLCAQIGFRMRDLDLPALYLDFASTTADSRQISSAIDSRSDAGVLLILDNALTDERLAAEIARHWQVRNDGSLLLILGRPETKSRLGVVGPLADLTNYEAVLNVGAETPAAVLFQEFRRIELPAPEVPREIVSAWGADFGEDMIALTAAIRKRARDLQRGDWRLAPADAVEYVRVTYLHNSDDTVNTELGALAVMSQIEAAVPEELLSPETIAHARERGLLKSSPTSVPGKFLNSLPHPAVGTLILAARAIDELEAFDLVLCRAPGLLRSILTRLRSRGSSSQAAALMRTVFENPKLNPFEVFTLVELAHLALDNERLMALPMGRLDEILTADPQPLVEAICTDTPDGVEKLLRRCRVAMPRTEAILRETCSDPRVARRHAELALGGGPTRVKVTFQFWNRTRMAEMASAQARLFESREVLEAFIDAALDRGPGSLADVLGLASEGVPALAAALADLMSRESERERVAAALTSQRLSGLYQMIKATQKWPAVGSALRSYTFDVNFQAGLDRLVLEANLADLGEFLRVSKPFRRAREQCQQTLAEPGNRKQMEAAARESPLRLMPVFLGQIRVQAPGLHEAIGEALSSPDAVDEAVERMLEQPRRLAGLRRFFTYTERYLPSLFDAFLSRLSARETAGPLARTAVRMQRLGDVTTLMAELEQLIPAAATRIREAMIQRPQVDHLVYVLARADNRELLAFTESFELAGEVWDEVQRELWLEACRRSQRPLDSVSLLGKLLAEIGRSDLERDLARAALDSLALEADVTEKTTLPDLAWVIATTRPPTEQLLELLELVVDRPWFAAEARLGSTAGLAGLVEACFALGGPQALGFLQSAALVEEIETGLAEPRGENLETVLVLLGAVSFVGPLADLSRSMVKREELADLLRKQFAPPFELSAQRALLLLGVAELAAARGTPLDLPHGAPGFLDHICDDGIGSPLGRVIRRRLAPAPETHRGG